MAKKFLKILRRFKSYGLDEITLYIRGAGGDFSSVFVMARAMRESGLKIGCVAHDCVNSGCFMLTQAGVWVAALPKTIFGFHRACLQTEIPRKGFNASGLAQLSGVANLLDSIQLKYFLLRGRYVEDIFFLFCHDADIDVSQAMRLGLIDCRFSQKEFKRDRNRIYKVMRNKK